MTTYTPTTFTIPCSDGYHDFNGFIAEDTGLGYYINPPVADSAPEYFHGPQGIRDSRRDNWYIIVHLRSTQRISPTLSTDENAARRLLEALAVLTDWTANTTTISAQPGMASKIAETVRRLDREMIAAQEAQS
jgi:predicted ATP-grasp superfamily ATP-dependent carboligase